MRNSRVYAINKSAAGGAKDANPEASAILFDKQSKPSVSINILPQHDFS